MKRLCTDVYAVSKTSCVNNRTIFEEKLTTEHQMCFFEKHLLTTV